MKIDIYKTFQTKQFSLNFDEYLKSYELFKISIRIWAARTGLKTFTNHFFKKLKIASYCVDFYEHGKLQFHFDK